MHCLIGGLALFAPRVVLVFVWLLSDFLGRAYDGVFWPLLGFFFMPLTTLAYAWAINTRGSVDGLQLVVVVLAVLVDLGLIGGSEAGRRRRSRGRD